MKPVSSQRQKKLLCLLIALSAILLLASLSLFVKTAFSFSNTSTEVHQEKPMLQEQETAEPQRPTVAQPEETVPEPTQSQHLSLQAFEAELSEYTPAYGDSAALQHGILCSNNMIERNGWLYFFTSRVGEDGRERTELSAYHGEDGTTISLLTPSETGSLRNLQEQNGILYVMAEDDLGRQALLTLPCAGGTPALLYSGDFLNYRVYGTMVFLQTEEALLVLPTDGTEEPVCLWKNTAEIELRSYCPSDTGVIVQLGSTNWLEKDQYLYLLPPEGGYILLFEGTETISNLTALGETVYFLYGETVQNASQPQLVTISLPDASATMTPLPRPAEEPAAYPWAFFAAEDQLVFCYRQWDNYALELYVTASNGTQVLEKYLYENPHGERCVDTMTAEAMLGKDLLYLQGKSYFTGIRTTTCIPRAASSDASCERNVA